MKRFFENIIAEKRIDQKTERSFSGSAETSIKEEKFAELEKYRQEAQALVDSYGRFFMTFAKDVSLSFKVSNGFFIDLEKGEVNLDAKWFSEKGFSMEQILWACLHELSHFRDLAEDDGVMKNFEYIKGQARKTGEVMLEKWEEKYGASEPDFVESLKKQHPTNPKKPNGETMNTLERSAYQIHHTFYNIFDDIYVNNLVARKSPAYEEGEAGGREISRLYQEKLFQGTDYSEKPMHLQFVYALIRQEMVKNENVKVNEVVKDALEKKIAFQGKEYSPREIVENFIKPKKNSDTLASQRYFALKKTLEPIFQELLLKDLEKWDPKKPEKQQQQKGKGESESGGGNPFKQDYQDYEENNPDQISEDDVKEWKKKKDADDKKAEDKKAETEAEDGKSSEEKAKDAQENLDKDWCEQNNLDYGTLQQFRKIESEVEPYLQDLSKLWQKIIFGSSKKIERAVEGGFKTGTELEIQKVVEQWPKISQQKFDDVRVMKRTVSREVLVQRPELIRVRLVGDMSGSMDEKKKHILQQCFVLLLSSLREFNTYLNLTRSQTKSKLEVDTEAWIFGNEAQKVKKLRSETGLADEQVEIVKIFEKLKNTIGLTYDNKALEEIQKAISPEDLEKISQKKILEIVLEITDGGSSSESESRRLADELENAGVVLRAFQIGKTSESEKNTFNAVWNDGKAENMGEIVGEEIGNLLPAVALALKKHLSGVQL